jgi:hypothetical protein
VNEWFTEFDAAVQQGLMQYNIALMRRPNGAPPSWIKWHSRAYLTMHTAGTVVLERRRAEGTYPVLRTMDATKGPLRLQAPCGFSGLCVANIALHAQFLPTDRRMIKLCGWDAKWVNLALRLGHFSPRASVVQQLAPYYPGEGGLQCRPGILTMVTLVLLALGLLIVAIVVWLVRRHRKK